MEINLLKDKLKSHRVIWKEKGFILSVGIGAIMLILSLFVNFWAGKYATLRASNFVEDLLFNILPIVDVSWLFFYGYVIFCFFTVLLLFFYPQKIPFLLKSMSLFIVIRGMFVVLTHIGPSPYQINMDDFELLRRFTFGGDLFFSSHTGMPFLFGLIFWREKIWRFVFFGISLMFGTIVLLGRLHYSIDVFAAFFITYTIYCIAQKFFYTDFVLSGNNTKAERRTSKIYS